MQGNFCHRSFLSSPLRPVIKTRESKIFSCWGNPEDSYVGIEVLSFFSAYSELFRFSSNCVSYFSINFFNTFPYMYVCTLRNVNRVEEL